MKCRNCNNTQFYAEAAVAANVGIVVDEDGEFLDFQGSVEDQIDISDIVSIDQNFVCTECGTKWDEVAFLNKYRCPKDGDEWVNEGEEYEDDTCPSCGELVAPYSSDSEGL